MAGWLKAGGAYGLFGVGPRFIIGGCWDNGGWTGVYPPSDGCGRAVEACRAAGICEVDALGVALVVAFLVASWMRFFAAPPAGWLSGSKLRYFSATSNLP